MAAITGLELELPFWRQGTSPTFVNFTLNQTTDQWEAIFQAPEDITCTRVGFRQGTVTGTAPTYKISVQSVTDGIPSGTILGGGTPASMTFTPVGGGNSTYQWKTLDNSIALTKGTFYAIVIAYDSGTVDASNNSSFTVSSALSFAPGTAYTIQNDNTVRTRQSATPVFGYGSAGTAYGFPVQTLITSSFNSGSTPDEKAALITIPPAWWSTYKINGAAIYGVFAAATTYDLTLYDTDGSTVLQSINIDTDNDRSAGGTTRRVIHFDESTLSLLQSGLSYYLSFIPAGTSLTLNGMTMAAAADLDAYLAGQAGCTAATRTNAGAWTADTTTRFAINPIIADISGPSPFAMNSILLMNSPLHMVSF